MVADYQASGKDCSAEKLTKHSSVLLPCLVSSFAEQSLFGNPEEIP